MIFVLMKSLSSYSQMQFLFVLFFVECISNNEYIEGLQLQVHRYIIRLHIEIDLKLGIERLDEYQ